MRFTVTARSTAGDVTFEHTSLLNALYLGMGLSASGMAEVRIADGSGPARTPVDVYRSMFGGDRGRGGDRAEGGVESVALAA